MGCWTRSGSSAQATSNTLTMDSSRLLLFTALLGLAASTPIATGGSKRDRLPPTVPVFNIAQPLFYPAGSGSVNLVPVADDGSPQPTATTVTYDVAGIKPLASRSAFVELGCTTSIQFQLNTGCTWDGTSTLYPSTVTTTKRINCNGCSNVSLGWGRCPVEVVQGFTSAKTPLTETVTACDISTIQGLQTQAGLAAVITPDVQAENLMAASPQTSVSIALRPRETGNAGAAVKRADVAACPTTVVAVPEQQAGKTSTTYSRYTTTTVKVNCGGCPLVVSTALMAYGPPSTFDKTTTLPVGTRTTYACS
ncbi:hypothetical protein QBC39DRAFT_348461 [Podospora conica]|nr:hypothetical protein QBC39DRAFT_348461 [Schizothecium conicum]